MLNQSLRTRWIIFIFWTALIALLMLTPGEPNTGVGGISGFFGGTEVSDWFGHLILFSVFATLAYWVLIYDEPHPARVLLISIALTLAYGTLTELLQELVPNRGATLIDMVGNWLGTVAFAVFIYWHDLS